MFESLMQSRQLAVRGNQIRVTRGGEAFLWDFGIDLAEVSASRRPLCKSCLDWSQRRTHLAGALGAALLERLSALKWARRARDSRAVIFTPAGEGKFNRLFA
jgi:hypothetical protein